MKYNKNADTLLFLLLFSTGQREKNIEKTFVSAGTIVSSRSGPPSPPPAPLSEGTPPIWVPPSVWSKLKKLPPFSDNHPNWCM